MNLTSWLRSIAATRSSVFKEPWRPHEISIAKTAAESTRGCIACDIRMGLGAVRKVHFVPSPILKYEYNPEDSRKSSLK